MIIPTQSIQHPDGSLELVRVVAPSLAVAQTANPLAFETSLIWMLPIDSLDYVRVAIVQNAKTPAGPLALKNNVVLAGYSKLAKDAPVHLRTKAYVRRIFYLTLEDASRNLNDVPITAVDPRTLLPGHLGSAPDVSAFHRAYPRHIRRRRRSLLRRPVELAPILASQHGLQLAAS